MILGKDINLSQILYNHSKHFDIVRSFDCGNYALNQFLFSCFNNHERVLYLFIDDNIQKIAAYSSLVCTSLIYSQESKQYQIPAIEIKTFAVDKSYQNLPFSGNRADGVLSDSIFNSMVATAFDLSETVIGAEYVTLYSVQAAQSFYERNGFSVFEENMTEFYNYFNESCIPMYFEL